jgi:hypothetical protein
MNVSLARTECHNALNKLDGCKHFVLRQFIRLRCILKSSIFWDIAPCKLLNVNLRFGATGRKQICYLLHAGFLRFLFFDRYLTWRRHVPPKRRLTFNGVISQETELF